MAYGVICCSIRESVVSTESRTVSNRVHYLTVRGQTEELLYTGAHILLLTEYISCKLEKIRSQCRGPTRFPSGIRSTSCGAGEEDSCPPGLTARSASKKNCLHPRTPNRRSISPLRRMTVCISARMKITLASFLSTKPASLLLMLLLLLLL